MGGLGRGSWGVWDRRLGEGDADSAAPLAKVKAKVRGSTTQTVLGTHASLHMIRDTNTAI